jgi:hypothetical protein
MSAIVTQTVLFLQNAWSPVYAGHEWPRDSWLRALERSRSGQRLRILIDDFEICENTTPVVGNTPSSQIAPNEAYILAVLSRRTPGIVIACGKQAESALSALWDGALLIVPHPAHRLLTDNLYRDAHALLAAGFSGRIALRQLRGSVQIEEASHGCFHR